MEGDATRSLAARLDTIRFASDANGMIKFDIADFEGRSEAIVDLVKGSGESVVIMRYGRALAELRPVDPDLARKVEEQAQAENPQDSPDLTGKVVGDIVSPLFP